MLNQAKSELPVRIDAFDGKPFAFNCGNGIVDLRTGELHPHDRAEMHTKLSPVMYDPSATAPKWETFLDRIFASDESLIRFVQRAAGYSLTGDVSEQCLFIAYGTGANGKSVFLKTIAALVADYGQATRTETLMVKRHVGVSNDIACLRGARFVSAFETDEGQRFAESNVKQLTGGDKIRARFLFKEEFEFAPQFKLWLAANHKPEIRGQDHAIWRRIKLIPFNVTIPQDERNAHLDAELQDELPGIFAWAVRGCMAWQSEGLGVTEAVKQATADYQFEMDALAEFFADRCEMDAHYEVSATEIYAAYKSWCQASGEEPESQKWLAVRLKERGCNVERRFKARIWKGIGLIKAADAT
jgi:putative DNA primase/helicase